METDLSASSVDSIKGIGSNRSDALASSHAIFTVGDLLYFFPRDYVDYRQIKNPANVEIEQEQIMRGRVKNISIRGRGRKKRLQVQLVGPNGAQVDAVWFRSQKTIRGIINRRKDEDGWILLSGTPSEFKGRPSFSHPDIHDFDDDMIGRIVPVYPEGEKLQDVGLSSTRLRNITWSLLSRTYDEELPHVRLPEAAEKQFDLMSGGDAIRHMHWPGSFEDLEEAIRRVKFEELFAMQLLMMRLRHERGEAPAMSGSGNVESFREQLSFDLTDAQSRSLSDILSDLSEPIQMNRLLQGDVGSGKTVVAMSAMVRAAENGHQSAFMAPTQILAEQHRRTLNQYAEITGLEIQLITGSMDEDEQRVARQRIASGEADIVVGTHALIQGDTEFQNLALAVVDEQHRFGVHQRRKLFDKNEGVHMLLMTATPIPRSMALGLYGDLSVSVIDEMPPGRKPVATKWVEDIHDGTLDDLEQRVSESKQQAFVVHPLVAPGKIDEPDATTGASMLDDRLDAEVGLIHGQVDNDVKEATMSAFESGDIDVLSATTVVEVGVDVPNATTMVIRGAHRFGLSQLHQLRGRVGRSDQQSYCILVSNSDEITDSGKNRLQAMCETNDGFEVAERDLEIRGIGEFFGDAQSGIGRLRVANPREDEEMMEKAQETADDIVSEDPLLSEYPSLAKELDDRFSDYNVELANIG